MSSLYTVHHSCVRTIFSRRGEFSDHHTTRAYVRVIWNNLAALRKCEFPAILTRETCRGPDKVIFFVFSHALCLFEHFHFQWGFVYLMAGTALSGNVWGGGGGGGRGSGADYPKLTSGIPAQRLCLSFRGRILYISIQQPTHPLTQIQLVRNAV
jgi:hypothetical protein